MTIFFSRKQGGKILVYFYIDTKPEYGKESPIYEQYLEKCNISVEITVTIYCGISRLTKLMELMVNYI